MYVSRHVHGSTHNDDLLDTEKGLWVRRRSQGQVCQGTNRHESDSIRIILTQDTEYLLMGWTLGGNKGPLGNIACWDRFDIDRISCWVEKVFPGFFGSEVWVLEQSVVIIGRYVDGNVH